MPALRCGNVVVAVQPSRGYDIDPKASYHAPDLVPPDSPDPIGNLLESRDVPTGSIPLPRNPK